jgi:phospholipase/carboxylesterase
MKSYWSESFEEYAESAPQLPESRTVTCRSDDDVVPVLPMARIGSVTEFARGYIPSNYEPGYAYPLIVWLTGPECPQHTSLSYVSQMSPQNYVGLAVNGCLLPPADSSYGAAFVTHLAGIENRIVSAVRAFRESVYVHADRVFLAGVGASATAALMVALHQADWFAGGISFGGEFPSAARLLAHRREVSGRRFWVTGANSRMKWPETGPVATIARELVALGADVTTHLDESVQPVSRGMLRNLDAWILTGILGHGHHIP